MATLSFHAPDEIDRKIREAAKKQGLSVSRYLLHVAEQAAEAGPGSGLGRELEKLAIDGMAFAAAERIRERAAATGADQWDASDIQNVVKASRRERR